MALLNICPNVIYNVAFQIESFSLQNHHNIKPKLHWMGANIGLIVTKTWQMCNCVSQVSLWFV